MEILNSRSLPKILILLLLLIISKVGLGQELFKKWVSENGDYSFEKNGNSWIDKKNSLSYSVVSINSYELILLGSRGNYLKLDENQCYTSNTNYKNDFKLLCSGYWVSNLPARIIVSNTSIKYGDVVTLEVPADAELAPGDEWQWFDEYLYGEAEPVFTGQRKIQISPKESTTIYYLSTKYNYKEHSSVPVKIIVDISSEKPEYISGDNVACIGSTVHLKVIGGRLGKDAKWIWYEEDQSPHQIATNKSEIDVVINKSNKYSVRAESNGYQQQSEKVYFTVNSQTPSEKPDRIKMEKIVYPDLPCKGENITLKVVGGKLGDGAVWVWYLDSDKDAFGKTGTKSDVFNHIANRNGETVYVKAKNSCNETEPTQRTIYLFNNGKTLENNPVNIVSSIADYQKRNKVILFPAQAVNAQTGDYDTISLKALKYNFSWLDVTANTIIDSSFEIKNIKLNDETHIRLTLSNKCESESRDFVPKQKWDTEENERKRISAKNKNDKEIKRYYRKSERTHNKKDKKNKRYKKRDSNRKERSENKTEKTNNKSLKKSDQKVKHEQSSYEDIPMVSGVLNVLGINNRSGQFGLGVNYNLRPSVWYSSRSFFSIGAGVGVGCGIKCYTEVSWTSAEIVTGKNGYGKNKNVEDKFSAHLGITYNSGVKGIQFSADTSGNNNSNITSQVNFNYLPVTCAYGGIAFEVENGVSLFIGYSHRLKSNYYQVSSSQPLSDSDKGIVNFLSLLSPGGIMIGLTTKF